MSYLGSCFHNYICHIEKNNGFSPYASLLFMPTTQARMPARHLRCPNPMRLAEPCIKRRRNVYRYEVSLMSCPFPLFVDDDVLFSLLPVQRLLVSQVGGTDAEPELALHACDARFHAELRTFGPGIRGDAIMAETEV